MNQGFGNNIGWGVDGHGYRHFICDKCGARLGKSKTAHNFEVIHECGDGTWKIDEEASVMGQDDLLGHLVGENQLLQSLSVKSIKLG